MATITITNPKYIQFKDATGALHYYQHYPPIERNDVTDLIFYGTKPYGYSVRSSVRKLSGLTTNDTTFCLYLYYTNNLTDFKDSKLEGSFTESVFNTSGSLDLTGLENWGMASAYSSYGRRLVGLKFYHSNVTDTGTRPDKSGSIHLFNSDLNYNTIPKITDDDWENLVLYTDAWRYVFGVGSYSVEANRISAQYIYLTCNPTMTTANLKAELIDPDTGGVICTAYKNKENNMAFKQYVKPLEGVRLRISNGKASYDRKIIFESIPSTSYSLNDSQTAHISGQGQWGGIERTYPESTTGALTNSINTFWGVNQLVQGGLRCNDKIIIDFKQTNVRVPQLYSFVISDNGYQHIAENPTTRGEFYLPKFPQLAQYIDSRIFYYNLDDAYKAFVQS